MNMKKMLIVIFCSLIALGLVLSCVVKYEIVFDYLYTAIKSPKGPAFTDRIDSLFAGIENGLKDGFVLKNESIDLFGGGQRLLGRRIVIGSGDTTLVKSDTGNLFFTSVTSSLTRSQEEGSAAIDTVSDFYQHCQEHQIDFLYVIAPWKNSYLRKEAFPEVVGMVDYQDQAKIIRRELEAEGVPCLDLQTLLYEEADDYSSAFFSTDHHWKIETAFWGFQKLCQALNEKTGFQIGEKYFDLENYTVDVMPKQFMGSIGKRAGKLYHSQDDLALIYPRYDTDFEITFAEGYQWSHSPSVSRSGTFEKVFLNYANPNTINYGIYTNGDGNVLHINNHLNQNGKKVLFIKDSFGIPVSTWLSCAAEELWVVDLRFVQKESMYDFVLNHGINSVILFYNAHAYQPSSFFTFDRPSQGE